MMKVPLSLQGRPSQVFSQPQPLKHHLSVTVTCPGSRCCSRVPHFSEGIPRNPLQFQKTVLLLHCDSITILITTTTTVIVNNPAILLLLLAFEACFEVSYLSKDASNEHYSSVMPYTPGSDDVPLSAPLSSREASSAIEGDFFEDDDQLIDLSFLSVFISKSTSSHYQNNCQFGKFLNCPFTPPESISQNRI